MWSSRRQAYESCQTANARLEAASVDWERLKVSAHGNEFVAFIAENALAELRALPPPKGNLARLEDEFALREQEIDVLREAAAAAAAGEEARADALKRERVNLTHQRDSRGFLPAPCPVNLPA